MSRSSARTLAENLAGNGRLLEAIEVLTTANREQRDLEIDVRLVTLRRDAFEQLGRSRGRRSWPPRVKDMFSRVDGIPEVTRDKLTPKLLRSAVFRHGCLLVRGLVGRTRVDQLVEDIDRAFAAYDAHAHGAPESETSPWFVQFQPRAHAFIPRPWLRSGGAILAVDSPPALFDVIETFEEVGIRRLVESFLSERPLLLAQKCTLRRASIDESFQDWHQDGSFMGSDIRSLDLWISLSHCGIDAPGLDIVPRRFDHIIETGTDDADYTWGVASALAERAAEGNIVRPTFEPGDAVLIDDRVLHRTAVDPGMTRSRYAIEAWFAAPSKYPNDQLPIAF